MNMTKITDEMLVKVSGGGGYDENDLTPEESAYRDQLRERIYQACEDFSRGLIDRATFIAIHDALCAYEDEMERKYG